MDYSEAQVSETQPNRGREIGVALLILVGAVTLFLAPPIGWGLVLASAILALVGPFGLRMRERVGLAVFAVAGAVITALLALLFLPAGQISG